MTPDEEAYQELCYYTLAHQSPTFVHQHVVDAFAAQRANEQTKPIKLTFALVGLYLHLERQFSGREVQRAHMTLARQKRAWPKFQLPATRGTMDASNVLAAPAGPARDVAIDAWCAAVWEAYEGSRRAVIELVKHNGVG